MNNIKFNDVNASLFNAVFLKQTYRELVKLPAVKPGIVIDYPDEHGTDRDDEVFFASTVYDLPLMIKGNTEAELLENLASFRAFIRDNKRFFLRVERLNRSFNMMYSSSNNFEWYADYVTFVMTVIDDYPDQELPYA